MSSVQEDIFDLEDDLGQVPFLPERLVFAAVLAAAVAINSSLEDSRSAQGGREGTVRSLQQSLSSVSFTGASVSNVEREGRGEGRGEGWV